DPQELYKEALEEHQRREPPETLVELRDRILNIREQITATESGWRSLLVERGGEGGYALWNLPETTIEQLILDFGSQDFAYVFSSEIANRTFSINSHIAIPRSAWSEVLELILNQQGIGIRTLNPFLKELYDLKNDASGLTLITSERLDLEMVDPNDRIGFVLTPESTSISQITRFLERFVNPLTVGIDLFSRNIFITALAREIREVLKLYDFAVNNRTDYQYKLIALRKVDADEMAQVLEALFESIEEKTTEESATTSTPTPSNRPPTPPTSVTKSGTSSRPSETAKTRSTQRSNSKRLTGTGLRIIPLQDVARAIFLVGTADEIAKAERVIQEVENQVNQAHGQVLFSYRVKHSDPEQLGQVLDKIYQLFLVERSSRPGEEGDAARKEQGQRPDSSSQSFSLSLNQPTQQKQDLFSTGLDDTQGFYLGGNNAIGGNLDSARPVQPAEVKQREFNKGRSNFLIDPSTNIMIMVVEPDILPRLRDLIKKIDVPRKMVKIDVLLFEKRVTTTEEMGLNLFRIGGKASDTKLTSAVWNDRAVTGRNAADSERDLVGQGILSFFLSRTRGHGVPAYDMAYRFLMSLQDVTINANPSVVTVNQLPAYIAIVEELSINTGVVEISSAGGPQSKDSFTRAQYGTIIKVTPTIHMKDVEDHSSWGDDVP
ncbi:MAG: hypothetical protein KDK40_04095, partial [Chlamydiia bacterium]|nr:hypothetical protein [Chlamydiia bacterium]